MDPQTSHIALHYLRLEKRIWIQVSFKNSAASEQYPATKGMAERFQRQLKIATHCHNNR